MGSLSSKKLFIFKSAAPTVRNHIHTISLAPSPSLPPSFFLSLTLSLILFDLESVLEHSNHLEPICLLKQSVCVFVRQSTFSRIPPAVPQGP